MRHVSAILLAVGFLLGGAQFANADDFDICLKSEGDPAIAACTRAILSGRYKGGDLAWLFNNRGSEYSGKSDYDRALADFNQAIRLNPKFAHAFHSRGRLYYNKRDFDRALADFNEAIRLNPSSDKFEDRGDTYFHKGDYDRAISDYSESIRLTPDSAAPHGLRCWSRAVANKQLTEALADCNKSLALRPGDASTLDSRGFVYFRLGRFDEAIADIEAALLKDPKSAESLFVRGLAKLKKGDSTGGNADIAAAEKLEPKIAEKYAKWGVRP